MALAAINQSGTQIDDAHSCQREKFTSVLTDFGVYLFNVGVLAACQV